MDFTWINTQDNLDWQGLSELYRIAPLGNKSPEFLQTVFTNSRYKWFVYHEGKLVAVGRALADGADCSYIGDVAVHPDYQGMKLGKQIIEKLVDDSKDHKKVILYANVGKEGFYTKLGFHPMNTAMAMFKDQQWALDAGVTRLPDNAEC
ncbi:MAG: GNAT family N-acetyltransferase [Phycisphaeraceae bacterium JB051]